MAALTVLAAPDTVWDTYARIFEDLLEQENKAPLTRRTYAIAVKQLGQYLQSRGMPTDPTVVTREHLTEWFRYLMRPVEEGGQGVSDATALQRYRSISVFFNKLVKIEEISESPMKNMEPPKVPEKLVPVVDGRDLKALLKATSGQDFASRRDRAIISLFIDTGIRISEMAGLRVDGLNMSDREAEVLGKGRRRRHVRFVTETRLDIQRYLLARSRHPHAESPYLWLGKQGQLTNWGIYQMVKRRCEDAGIAPIHPHQLRHTFAHLYLANGGSEGDLMRIAGWASRSLLDRYGASVARQRALTAHDGVSPRKGL